ncbi:MAG: ADP-glyceromanno-heptose 6-epimerase [Bacteroidales bacterium]|nr:ADP-glyceromanno-heptose 6-epimerase [Bacteroidales bacterium]
MIAITGAAGFIASNLIGSFNLSKIHGIIVVDRFTSEKKNKNLADKHYHEQIDRDHFISWFVKNHQSVEFVFHLGARTDTTEFRKSVFDRLNLEYSKRIWEICSKCSIPLVYASSAATYGMGELGYHDVHEIIPRLKPLNPYGDSKNEFDKWVLKQTDTPPYWTGLKFFNVYGPNEYHKGRMASVVYHAYEQIRKRGVMRLFRSHRIDVADGEQKRDFIYVRDVVDVMLFFYHNRPDSGIYNVGTGRARSFLELTKVTFSALNMVPNIEFIDTPADIRDTYQYFTEADMKKLYRSGYTGEFTPLDKGVKDYLQNYLIPHKYR